MSWTSEHIVSRVNLSDTLRMTEIGPKSGDCGFWLWDATQRMNLAIRAKTREAALLYALRFYQTYSAKWKAERDALQKRVDSIREIIGSDEEEDA
jgi:hypothetical protein